MLLGSSDMIMRSALHGTSLVVLSYTDFCVPTLQRLITCPYVCNSINQLINQLQQQELPYVLFTDGSHVTSDMLPIPVP